MPRVVHQTLGPERDETLAPLQLVPRQHFLRLFGILSHLPRVPALVAGPLGRAVEIGDGVRLPGAPVHVRRRGARERDGQVPRGRIRRPVRPRLPQPVVAKRRTRHRLFRFLAPFAVLTVPVRHLRRHPDVLGDVGNDGLDVGHADGHLRPTGNVPGVPPRRVAVDACGIFPLAPRLRLRLKLVRLQPRTLLRRLRPRLALAPFASLHRALALFPARDALDALRNLLGSLRVLLRRPKSRSVRLNRSAHRPVPQGLNPRVHLPQRLEDVLLLLRGHGRVRQLGLHRRLPSVVEQVAVVEPGGDDVVHEQTPGLRLLLRDSRDLAHGRRDRGIHALLRGDVRLLRPSRACLLGAPQGLGVLVAERDLRLLRAGNLDQRAHHVLVLGISDGVVDLHVVGLDPAHAVVGDAVLLAGFRVDAHELGGDPIRVRHRFLRFRFFTPGRLGESGSDRDFLVRLGLDAG
mmetsp:Transcript_6907/g.31418  ORF Transcript_6907/g.31418 Transcript_6907/m.31418 type:complete len:461 (-) Transcript_6907:278-1660(-)